MGLPSGPRQLFGVLREALVQSLDRQLAVQARIARTPKPARGDTCLIRWAPHIDPWTPAYLAGHRDMAITNPYLHPQADTIREAIEKARVAKSGHTSGHIDQLTSGEPVTETAAINCFNEREVARPEGLEPPAYWFEASRSIQLSYGRVKRRAEPVTAPACRRTSCPQA